MKKIIVSDMTLKKQSSLTFKEKIEIARLLDNLSVDVIYMPDIENTKADSLLIRTVAAFSKHSTLAVSVGKTRAGVEAAAAALSGAKSTRLTVSLPVSAVQMEYIYALKPPKMLALGKELFEAACQKVGEVEFMAEDATRADISFLASMIDAAIEAGVKTITLCDDEGAMLPDEFSAFLTDIKEKIPALRKVKLAVLCRSQNGLATASAVLAMKCGIDEIKCAVDVAELPSTESFASILFGCGDRCGFSIGVNENEIHRITKQIRFFFGNGKSAEKPLISENDSRVFRKDESPETIAEAVRELGYDLSNEDQVRVYEEFCRVSEKKTVTRKDLDAVIASVALQVPPIYRLKSYVINNGNLMPSSAQITLTKDDCELSGISIGDGPIDAAFRTIEQIIGHHYELDDFSIQSVTEGREAVGSAIVRLRQNGKLYSGNGISTDIIGASIRAYVNAVNKIVYEEENK